MIKPVRMTDVSAVVREHKLPSIATNDDTRTAAVAAILRDSEQGVQVLFMRRAKREGDPWSGHMAFPGGHSDTEDASLVHTAIRETREEIGLDLNLHGELLGFLDNTRPTLNSERLNMMVVSYVFAVQGEHSFQLNNDEADEVMWGSLNDMLAGKNHTTHSFHIGKVAHRYPGFDLNGNVIWGLTYRMVGRLLELLRPGWQP